MNDILNLFQLFSMIQYLNNKTIKKFWTKKFTLCQMNDFTCFILPISFNN